MSRFVRRIKVDSPARPPQGYIKRNYVGRIVQDHKLIAENSRRVMEQLACNPNDAGYRLRMVLAMQRGYN